MKVITAYISSIVLCAFLALQSPTQTTFASYPKSSPVTCIAEEQAPIENQALRNAGAQFIGFQYYPEGNRSTFTTAGRLACYAMPVKN